MKKSNLYTRTGDAGTTSLVGGERVAKNSVRLEAYGTIDEFSSFIGMLLSSKDIPQPVYDILIHTQNKLFNIGAYLATDSTSDKPATLYGLNQDDITKLEKAIDTLDADTPAVHAFVLPGGSQASALAHVARTVCRRAERRILDLAQTAPVSSLVLEYINRLSDYLFIVARNINHHSGIKEIIWDKNL
jgi:cob(I)alamin adenosyltransferase